MKFLDRTAAGHQLAERLQALRLRNPAILVMPPGGVRIGYEVARTLGAPMDVVMAHRVILPGAEGVILGAVAGGRFRPDERILRGRRIPREYAERLADLETARQEAHARACRRGLAPLDLGGRTAVLVDDGATCEITAAAVVEAVRARGARQIIYAAPVVVPEVFTSLVDTVEFVTLFEPLECHRISSCYQTFEQTTTEETAELLARTRSGRAPSPPAAAHT